MSYQDPIETNLLQLFAHSEYKRMVVYNFCFCYYFWGQHCCWTETRILATIFLFFISFHLPQLFCCLPSPHRCSGARAWWGGYGTTINIVPVNGLATLRQWRNRHFLLRRDKSWSSQTWVTYAG